MPVSTNSYGPDSNAEYLQGSIADGQSLSDSFVLNGALPVRLETPSGLAGSVASFRGALASGELVELYDSDGSAYTVAIGASRSIRLDPSLFAGLRELQVRTGTSGSPSTQTGAKTIRLGIMGVA